MTEMVHGIVQRPSGDAILSKWWRTVDRWSMLAVFALFFIGILLAMAASVELASENELAQFHYVRRQIIFGMVALPLMVVTSMLPIVLIRRLAVLGALLGVAALIALLFFGLDHGKGAVRWFSLMGVSVQPSELIKPCFVVASGWFLAARLQINGPPGGVISFMFCMLVVGLLVLQPDFGQAFLVLSVWVGMFFVGAGTLWLLAAVFFLALFAGWVAYQMSEHVARRIDGFLTSDVDPTSQIGYAINAIREGGVFGVGLGNGQVKFALPDAHTDFIIAVAAEEFGLFMVLGIIGLYLFIALRAIHRLTKERDSFLRISGAGLAAMFAFQAFINIGVAVRLLPAKGMTLPFISYGGSSLIAVGIMLGILLAFTRRRPQGRYHDYMTGAARG
jgi:cell division protein FtsW